MRLSDCCDLVLTSCQVCSGCQNILPVLQVFADVAKRYLHEVAAVRQQGSASTSAPVTLGKRVSQTQRRSQSFFRDEVPQDPAGQVSHSPDMVTRAQCRVSALTTPRAGKLLAAAESEG